MSKSKKDIAADIYFVGLSISPKSKGYPTKGFKAGATWAIDEVLNLVEAENENLNYSLHGQLNLENLIGKIKELKK